MIFFFCVVKFLFARSFGVGVYLWISTSQVKAPFLIHISIHLFLSCELTSGCSLNLLNILKVVSKTKKIKIQRFVLKRLCLVLLKLSWLFQEILSISIYSSPLNAPFHGCWWIM